METTQRYNLQVPMATAVLRGRAVILRDLTREFVDLSGLGQSCRDVTTGTRSGQLYGYSNYNLKQYLNAFIILLKINK